MLRRNREDIKNTEMEVTMCKVKNILNGIKSILNTAGEKKPVNFKSNIHVIGMQLEEETENCMKAEEQKIS